MASSWRHINLAGHTVSNGCSWVHLTGRVCVCMSVCLSECVCRPTSADDTFVADLVATHIAIGPLLERDGLAPVMGDRDLSTHGHTHTHTHTHRERERETKEKNAQQYHASSKHNSTHHN